MEHDKVVACLVLPVLGDDHRRYSPFTTQSLCTSPVDHAFQKFHRWHVRGIAPGEAFIAPLDEGGTSTSWRKDA
ncbi:hypothetical protein GCM10023193_10920 [Planotetraspora kaengkrachanensis]|uniref:Uncharacterized protein n=1 Tax=Planotetraspora kaengkrachanensis TaxID=575193 RepID=A0A8J3PPV2_9ACTN|nr:hypothetical protein Pka01_05890 [Planotetraspora kaengkrachanensis]